MNTTHGDVKQQDDVEQQNVRQVSLIILGASGDLAQRLLLPGLASLLSVEEYEVQLIGSSDETLSEQQWKERVDSTVSGNESPAPRSRITETIFRSGDATDPDLLRTLLDDCRFTPIIYFALPPAVTAKVCAALQSVTIPAGTRLAFEKPFGVDLESAQHLNDLVRKLVPETQVFRIDHFLGKSTVLNILGLRFANRIFEAVWNADNIERVEIVFDETLALEGRGRYYDKAGALIDMLQSHLLEVLALVAMEPPPKLNEVELRSNAAQVLRNTRVWGDDPVSSSRRARYTAGRIGDRTLPSYADEVGVEPTLQTETLAQLTCEINVPRWRGVPFVLRSGKALGNPRTQLRIRVKATPPLPGFTGAMDPDLIVLDLNTGTVELRLTMNGSGDPFTLEQGRFVAQVEPGRLSAYGEVLHGLLSGDPTLSIRDDIVEDCWRVVSPVVEAWRSGKVPLEEYPAGSAGPEGWEPAAALS